MNDFIGASSCQGLFPLQQFHLPHLAPKMDPEDVDFFMAGELLSEGQEAAPQAVGRTYFLDHPSSSSRPPSRDQLAAHAEVAAQASYYPYSHPQQVHHPPFMISHHGQYWNSPEGSAQAQYIPVAQAGAYPHATRMQMPIEYHSEQCIVSKSFCSL